MLVLVLVLATLVLELVLVLVLVLPLLVLVLVMALVPVLVLVLTLLVRVLVLVLAPLLATHSLCVFSAAAGQSQQQRELRIVGQQLSVKPSTHNIKHHNVYPAKARYGQST